MATQAEKGAAFRALHERAGAFVIPNPWDAGSAVLLAHVGFEALATTSAGFAFSIGRPDASKAVTRDEALHHAGVIAGATDLPVSADLESGFGDDVASVEETYRLAGGAGLAGASIEDATGDPGEPIYPLDVAVERVRAAVRAVRALPFDFTLTARAENFLYGRADLDDTIARLRAYQNAGADVVYAPGLPTRAEIGAVVKGVRSPVNVVVGLRGEILSVAELADLGVKRISLGGTLARAALGALMGAATEIRERGTFEFAKQAAPFRDLNGIFDSAWRKDRSAGG